ncbi:TPA: hypothetical protein GLX13_18420 [Escherichia coli]|nr:hypothetical protein [Escherichia coli]EJD7275402.1 hypothetical protein [Escherichia coli]HAH2030698.1 hypothetical protein [Escherichia coli]
MKVNNEIKLNEGVGDNMSASQMNEVNKGKNKITMHVYARERAVSWSEREDWQLISDRLRKKINRERS